MKLKKVNLRIIEITSVIVFATVLFAILSYRSPIPWNTGATERLIKSLRQIRDRMPIENVDDKSRTLEPRNFHFRSHGEQIDKNVCRELAAKFGVELKWHVRGKYEQLLFYPIAVSGHLVLHPNKIPMPLVVMVPFDLADKDTFLNLYGGSDPNAMDPSRRQIAAIKEAFEKYGIEEAAVLLSDGTFEYFHVDELF